MEKMAIIVTDLGPGDGGKGGVVHETSLKCHAHTIIKVGGAQGSHGVVTSAGESYAFSQWGCGTFEDVRTHISGRFVVTPEGLLNEAAQLRYEHGIHDPFALLTIDEEALCATPLHGVASHLKELARGASPRGTVGTGVGEAYRMLARHPELAIRVRDLSRTDLRDLIVAQREAIQRDLEAIIMGEFLENDREAVAQEILLLNDPGFISHIEQRFREVSRRAKIVNHEYMEREILSKDGVVVVESSHGVLTDHYLGFHPHTSALRTLPRFARAMIENAGYDGRIVSLGVTRAYQIRHGAGPMPTFDPEMTEQLLSGSHKRNNRYRGEVRVGPLDLNLLRYAIAASGGPSAYDGLAVTWFDQINANRGWQLCLRYDGADDERYFTPSGGIKVRFGEDEAQLMHQQGLTERLFHCRPVISKIPIAIDKEPKKLYKLCADTLHENLGVPVRMVSFGPTETDKMCR